MSNNDLRKFDDAQKKRALKGKWLEIWNQVGHRLLNLPEKEQEILLDDFLTAIKSRLMVFERILQKRKMMEES